MVGGLFCFFSPRIKYREEYELLYQVHIFQGECGPKNLNSVEKKQPPVLKV